MNHTLEFKLSIDINSSKLDNLDRYDRTQLEMLIEDFLTQKNGAGKSNLEYEIQCAGLMKPTDVGISAVEVTLIK